MAVYPQKWQQNKTLNLSNFLRWLLAPLLGVALLVVWIKVAESGRYPAFILPHPQAVIERLQTLYERDILLAHVQVTIREAVTGLALAIALALPLGYLVARFRWISALLMPYLVAVRAIPVVAIAAILVIWLGTGIQSKVFVVVFITWFPLMEATVVGIQAVNPRLRDLLRAYEANPIQVFLKLELPSAMPNLLSGLKIAATLSVVGAAVSEMLGANKGLAYLIVYGRGTSDAPLVFGSVLLLTAISLTFYGIVALVELIVLRWRNAH